MTEHSLVINFSDQTTPHADEWLRLEQIKPEGLASYASLKDVHDMWIAAVTGRSAHLVRSTLCPMEFAGSTVRIFLGFYIWPSRQDLHFSLSTALGTISTPTAISKYRQFSLFVDNQASIDLDYFMPSAVVEFETPAYNAQGEEIEPPFWWVEEGCYLHFSAPVFGAIRVSGIAEGFHAVCTMELDKPVDQVEPPEDYSIYPDNVIIWGVPPVTTVASAPRIENLENTITATWQDGENIETEQLRLEIPPCVKAMLAMCPDMYQTIVLLCNEVSTLQVFYNACTGELLNARPGKDPVSFCTPISGTVTANPWGLGTL